ncbi:MAG: hypothetical protein U0841_14455 [Chloroflexia bacterium]
MFRRIVVGFIILATLLGAAKVDPESLPHVRAAPQQGTVVTGIPAFFDLAVDDAHGRLFGTEKAAGRVVVLGLPNLNTITTISLGQASSPSGLSLSSDGTQLAVALFGFGSIALIDTATLTVTDHLYPNVTVGASYPYDVRYGVAGRLYSVGNPNSGRLDYVHAFDTATGEEIGASSTVVRGGPRLAITADKSTLYVSEPDFSPQQVYRFAVTSNTPTKTGQGPHGPVIASTIAARSDGNALFTSYGQVWSGDLTQKIGAFEAFGGNIEYIPALDRLYVSQGATVVEIDAQAPYDVLARRRCWRCRSCASRTLPERGCM